MRNRYWQYLAMVTFAGACWAWTVAAAGQCPAATPAVFRQPSTLTIHQDAVPVPGSAPREPERKSPFQEEPRTTPSPDEAYQKPPAEFPPVPPVPPVPPRAGSDAAAPADEGPCEATCESPCGAGDVPSCRRGLLGFLFSGWIDQGITANDRGSPDRFNGPLTFNDREGEYQLNQAYLLAERKTDTGGSGWDLGGRADLLYGTDWRFTQAQGLESRWNSERFYGLGLPQLYTDVAWNNWTVRMGKFYTVMGYEVCTAPDNFFYSHSYSFQYGEPLSHTGLLAKYRWGDTWTLAAGFDRGWDKWEDNNGKLEAIAHLVWTSCDQRTSLAFALTSGAWDDAGLYNRTMYSIVFTHQFTCRFKYVLQHDLGFDDEGGLARRIGGREDAEWYSVNQYLYYQVDECWGLGFRFEWFRDDDGTRVGGLGDPHGWALGPNIPAGQPGWAGNFYQMTAGLNWKPRPNFILRPECRWDWYSGSGDAFGRRPYSFGARTDQFTFATDLIVRF